MLNEAENNDGDCHFIDHETTFSYHTSYKCDLGSLRRTVDITINSFDHAVSAYITDEADCDKDPSSEGFLYYEKLHNDNDRVSTHTNLGPYSGGTPGWYSGQVCVKYACNNWVFDCRVRSTIKYNPVSSTPSSPSVSWARAPECTLGCGENAHTQGRPASNECLECRTQCDTPGWSSGWRDVGWDCGLNCGCCGVLCIHGNKEVYCKTHTCSAAPTASPTTRPPTTRSPPPPRPPPPSPPPPRPPPWAIWRSTSDGGGGGGGGGVGVIAGAAAGGVVLLGAVVAGVVVYQKSQKKRGMTDTPGQGRLLSDCYA
eukprot:295620-Pyramimonas_sp.AAC.1